MTDIQTPETQETAVQAVKTGEETSRIFTFGFKTDKIRDDSGEVIGNGRKHPDVKATIAIPTYQELAATISAGGKAAELILETVADAIYNAARKQINDWRETNGLEKNFTTNDFDLSKLTLEAIANMPKGERASSAISEEEWSAFLSDYTHVMVNIVGYDPKRVKLAVSHFKVKLARIKADKAAVQKLLDLLNVWASKTESLEDNAACFEDLTKRAEKYLEAPEKVAADAF